MEQELQDSTSSSRPGRSRRPWWWALAAVAIAGAMFAGGIAAGAGSIEPKNTDEYKELMVERNGIASELQAREREEQGIRDAAEERETALQEREVDLDGREAELDERSDDLDEREAELTGAEEEKEANTVTDGTWTVGADIAAGTYRADESVGSRCYWAILRSGTNGDDIVSNDIPGGGRPSVTVSEGQDFNSSRCGSWSKQ